MNKIQLSERSHELDSTVGVNKGSLLDQFDLLQMPCKSSVVSNVSYEPVLKVDLDEVDRCVRTLEDFQVNVDNSGNTDHLDHCNTEFKVGNFSPNVSLLSSDTQLSSEPGHRDSTNPVLFDSSERAPVDDLCLSDHWDHFQSDHKGISQAHHSYEGDCQINPSSDISNTEKCWWWFGAHKRRCSICKVANVSVQELSAQLELHCYVVNSKLPNFRGCRLPVQSNLQISFWREALVNYEDRVICDFLEFGFPIGVNERNSAINCEIIPANHLGATQFPLHILGYLEKEMKEGAILGPFKSKPFSHKLVISPINSVPKKGSEERRIVIDLSWPKGFSVNDGIAKNEYLGEEVNLKFPTVDALIQLIKIKGRNSLMFKKDLRRAYRQLPVDPGDWNYLGYQWKSHLFMDKFLTMGLRSACMCCQRTTDAVKFMYSQLGYELVNYIDDLAGVEYPASALKAFKILEDLLDKCGLQESVEKSCIPSTIMVFLGVLLNSITLTMEIVPERLEEILNLLQGWEEKTLASKKEVQSLVGKLVFIAACVKPGRIFLSRMLNFLRSMPEDMSVVIPLEFFKDVLWWRKFTPLYQGVSMMFLEEWNTPDDFAASDACLTGCGGVCGNKYFHAVFPSFIQNQSMSINALELLGICVCAKLWGKLWSGKKILFNCDNMSSVYVLNSGRSQDRFLQQCLREISYSAAVHEFQIRAQHIPGVDNRLPDYLSRWHLNRKYSELFFESIRGAHWQECFIMEDIFSFSHEW